MQLPKKLAQLVVGAATGAIVLMPLAAGAVVITGLVPLSDAAAGQGWAVHPDQTGGGTEQFVQGPATPPAGTGSLSMTVAADTDRALVFTVPKPALGGVVPPGDIAAAIATPWGSTSGSFSTYTENTTSPASSIPALKFVGFQVFNAANPLLSTGFTTLNFEGSNQGAVTPNAWQTWTLGPTSLVWQSNTTDGFCLQAAPCTLAAFAANYPNGAWGQLQLGLGAGVAAGTVGYVDNVTVSDGTTTFVYDFEVAQVPTTTTTTTVPSGASTTAPPAATSGGTLVRTGWHTGESLGVAVVLLGTGVALMAKSRRLRGT